MIDLVKKSASLQAAPQATLSKSTDDQLDLLLRKFSSCFATKDDDIGRINIEQHSIKTTDHNPIAQRPYRQSAADNAETARQIKQLLDAGLIRESKSPWA